MKVSTVIVFSVLTLLTTGAKSINRASDYGSSRQKDIVGKPLVEALSPRGLRVSLPHMDGMELFSFHGKVNSPITRLEGGNLAKDVRFPTNGRWVFEDKDVQLLIGDVINYWIFVQINGMGHRVDGLTTIIREFTHSNPPSLTSFASSSPSPFATPPTILEERIAPFSISDYGIQPTTTKCTRGCQSIKPKPIIPPEKAVKECACNPEHFTTISAQLNVTLAQLNTLNDKFLPLQTQVDSLRELVQELIKDMNVGTQLLLTGQEPPGRNALEAIRQLITEKLDLIDLENKIRSAQRTNNGILFEMTSPIDKRRILLRAKKKLNNANYKIQEPQDESSYYAQKQPDTDYESKIIRQQTPQSNAGQRPNNDQYRGSQETSQNYDSFESPNFQGSQFAGRGIDERINDQPRTPQGPDTHRLSKQNNAISRVTKVLTTRTPQQTAGHFRDPPTRQSSTVLQRIATLGGGGAQSSSFEGVPRTNKESPRIITQSQRHSDPQEGAQYIGNSQLGYNARRSYL